MPINFIPNDPLADDTFRVIKPRPDRPANRAGFAFKNPASEDKFDLDTPGFLFWQCREAALAAVEAWEDLTGTLSSWQPGKQLKLLQDEGVDLNAFYDRDSLSFFHFPIGSKTYFSGASTDVVAHEAGHALLDSIRPELFDTNLFEPNALHEAFGDCVAILTALFDKQTRIDVLSKVSQQNFAEATAEYLADGIKRVNANHNAAAPRHARSKYKWQLPSTLPDFDSAEDGPGVLINEIHSFGQVFSGCFYDTIVNVFNGTSKTEADLLESARTVGKLLVAAITQAPQKARFFREVGRAMVLIDQQKNGGANRDAIKTAFEGHNVVLGTGAMLSPTAALAGAAPTLGDKASLTAGAKRDLLGRMGAAGARLAVSGLKIAGEAVLQAVHERLVPLDSLHKKLKGVVAAAPETALVGDSGGRAAVLGLLPEAISTADEVNTFVRSLLKQGAIYFDPLPAGKKKVASAVAGLAAAAKHDELPPPVTHAIKEVRGEKQLVRIRFACRGCRCRL